MIDEKDEVLVVTASSDIDMKDTLSLYQQYIDNSFAAKCLWTHMDYAATSLVIPECAYEAPICYYDNNGLQKAKVSLDTATFPIFSIKGKGTSVEEALADAIAEETNLLIPLLIQASLQMNTPIISQLTGTPSSIECLQRSVEYNRFLVDKILLPGDSYDYLKDSILMDSAGCYWGMHLINMGSKLYKCNDNLLGIALAEARYVGPRMISNIYVLPDDAGGFHAFIEGAMGVFNAKSVGVQFNPRISIAFLKDSFSD